MADFDDLFNAFISRILIEESGALYGWKLSVGLVTTANRPNYPTTQELYSKSSKHSKLTES